MARAKEFMESLTTIPLLIIDDFGMRKLPMTAAEDLLEIVMRRYERASTLLTSNRPVEDWGKLLGDVAAVSAMVDHLLHHWPPPAALVRQLRGPAFSTLSAGDSATPVTALEFEDRGNACQSCGRI